MVALAANFDRTEQQGELLSLPVKASTRIYKGALVMIGADGYLAPAIAEAGAVFAGVAYEECDNSTGANAAVSCLIELDNSFQFAAVGLVAADHGKRCYATDDNTIQIAAGSNLVPVGKIMKVISATLALVKIDPLQVKA